MILSFWRKSHLLLAISASLFLIIASITGSVLSFEPINNSLQASYVGAENDRSVAQLINQLDKIYPEVLELEIDDQQLLQISVMDEEGEFSTFNIHPKTGKKVSKKVEENSLFNFCRNLHRSLFLGSSGRLIMGFASFLLVLISISGIALVIKRQLGTLKFFSKVTNSTKYQYNHITLGRLSVFILLILALTGSFLSIKRFELFPEPQAQEINFSKINFKKSIQKKYLEFKAFQDIQLNELTSLTFPFSDDAEDYFEIQTTDKKLLVNQFNGSVLAQTSSNPLQQFYQLNFNLHTGKGSVLWSIVLCIASLSILFFIYSGFKMTLARRKGKIKNKFKKEECSTVILVGSEGGQTWAHASYVYQQLLQNKVKVFMDDMNNYTTYPELQNLLIITSTYGNGTAPSNADQFIAKYDSIKQNQPFSHSVLAFGSIDYDKYCQFGQDVFEVLDQHTSKMPLTRINKQSEQQFNSWASTWFSKMELNLKNPFTGQNKSLKKEVQPFKVVNIIRPTKTNNSTFSLELSNKNVLVQPGDLFLVTPRHESKERYYSCGVNEKGNIILVVKLHEFGKASAYLSSLKKGQKISARILANPHFNYPNNAKDVIAICNGTGIAPFIGMAEKSNAKQKFSIYWGLKSEALFAEVRPYFENAKAKELNPRIQTCYSAIVDTAKTYVQEKIEEDGQYVAQVLQDGGTILICGSIEMRNAVLTVLENITNKYNHSTLETYLNNHQIKIDCY